jgi:hypothetical protein
MTEIQNPKQLAIDLNWDLVIVIWNLFEIWCLSFVISGLGWLGLLKTSGRFGLLATTLILFTVVFSKPVNQLPGDADFRGNGRKISG